MIEPPTVQVARGPPDDTELAALLVALAAARTAATTANAARATPPRSVWADPARLEGDTVPRPGLDAWRRSALPD